MKNISDRERILNIHLTCQTMNMFRNISLTCQTNETMNSRGSRFSDIENWHIAAFSFGNLRLI